MLADDESAVMPDVADGTAVRWADVAAPWLADIGGDSRGPKLAAAAVARVNLRYDETKADLVHDDEFECVLFPLGEQIDASQMVKVDYDDRDLRTDCPRRRDLPADRGEAGEQDVLVIAQQGDPRRTGPDLDGRDPVERGTQDLRAARRGRRSVRGPMPRRSPTTSADAEIAKLRDKYESKAKRLRDQIAGLEDKIDLLEEQSKSKRNSELLSTAGSVLGGLLGGRKSKGGMLGGLLGKAGTAVAPSGIDQRRRRARRRRREQARTAHDRPRRTRSRVG